MLTLKVHVNEIDQFTPLKALNHTSNQYDRYTIHRKTIEGYQNYFDFISFENIISK